MKISVATLGWEADALIPSNLLDASHLFIVDVEKFEVVCVLPAAREKRDVAFAEWTVEANCEAIICGEVEREAFELLARACVSRYLGAGETVSCAIRSMNAYRLPLIREYRGGSGCPGESGDGECHEHPEEDGEIKRSSMSL